MGKLRDRMEQDLKLGGYSPATQRIYLLYAREFARYHMRSPAAMGEEEIRAYLLHRIEQKCSHETYRQVWAGLKFLYTVTLRRPIEVEPLPFRRKPPRLPQVISGTEVSALGKYRWFLFRWNPLRDEQGRVARWYAAATDIEDRKQAEQRLQNENVALREEIDRTSMFEEIVGISPALHAVLSRVSKVAPTDSTVLITGETGPGKELIARAVHRRSQRCSRAFVSVNCAAVPRDLIASELFGHERCAFTGAT